MPISSKTVPPTPKSYKNLVPGLFPVLTASELLAAPERRVLLSKIRERSGLDNELYPHFYETLIHNFVEFVQLLPTQGRGRPGSLMDYGLEKSAMALEGYHKKSASDFSALRAYAIFSSALLLDVGKVFRHRVIFSDEQGRFLSEWRPFEGAMVGKGDYYKIRYLGDQWISLGQSVTILIAKQLLSQMGFSWLAGDYQLIQNWLDVLAGHAGDESVFQNLLRLINQQWEELHEEAKLPPFEVEEKFPEETQLGEEFLAWLSEKLRNGTIKINNEDGVHQLETGELLVEQKVFKNFSEGHPRRPDAVIVCQQCDYLGRAPLAGEADLRFKRFHSKAPGSALARSFLNNSANQSILREGLLIKTDAIYQNSAKPPVSSLNLQPVQGETRPLSSQAQAKALLQQFSISLDPASQLRIK